MHMISVQKMKALLSIYRSFSYLNLFFICVCFIFLYEKELTREVRGEEYLKRTLRCQACLLLPLLAVVKVVKAFVRAAVSKPPV